MEKKSPACLFNVQTKDNFSIFLFNPEATLYWKIDFLHKFDYMQHELILISQIYNRKILEC